MLPRSRISSGATCVSQRRERQRRKKVCAPLKEAMYGTSRFSLEWQALSGELPSLRSEQEAKKVESLVLARLLEDGRAPGNKKIPTLADFSNRFFTLVGSLAGEPSAEGTNP